MEGLQTFIKLHLDKLNGLNHEVDYHTKVVGGLDQHAQLGVSSYHNTCKEYEDINSNITKAEQALVAIQDILESVQNQVVHMHLRFRICIFPLPIVHASEQAKDRRSFIIKACPLCQEWFHANDIVVAYCLFSHI